MTRAYHFVGGRLRDGRPVPADGVWLTHEGPVFMCRSGLHFSRHPFDALRYAPGPVLCLVDVEGVVQEDGDKGVCRRRRIVRRLDASRLLREFAADCAEDVWHLVQPDAQLAAAWAIDAARRFARGETDKDELAAAADAAAYAAADAAAYAAHAAADAAADAAAYAAAANAAAAYARQRQRARFARLVNAEFAL